MSGSRHATPMFVDIDNRAQALTPVRLGQSPNEDGARREAFIQNLVHDHPALIPMAEIEPAFSPLIAVCKELPTPAGYLDNLWITPWGGLILGEAKLVRNPQARREVVAQTLDYARAVAGWAFDDLEAAVRIALKQPTFTLWSLVRDETDLDEEQFVDAVQRRLRSGRLMLLIIGDGIQEGVEALTSHLQLHAGLHVGLALLDLSLWRNVDGGLIVVPRVPMRTVLIERGIVRIDGGIARIDPPAPPERTAPLAAGPAKPRAITSSEGEFFDHLAVKRPDLAGPLRDFLSGLTEIGISPAFGKSAILRFLPDPNTNASAGYVEATGKFWAGDAWNAAKRAGKIEIGEAYLGRLADLIGGEVRRYEKSPPQIVDRLGKAADVGDFLDRPNEWKAGLADLIAGLHT